MLRQLFENEIKYSNTCLAQGQHTICVILLSFPNPKNEVCGWLFHQGEKMDSNSPIIWAFPPLLEEGQSPRKTVLGKKKGVWNEPGQPKQTSILVIRMVKGSTLHSASDAGPCLSLPDMPSPGMSFPLFLFLQMALQPRLFLLPSFQKCTKYLLCVPDNDLPLTFLLRFEVTAASTCSYILASLLWGKSPQPQCLYWGISLQALEHPEEVSINVIPTPDGIPRVGVELLQPSCSGSCFVPIGRRDVPAAQTSGWALDLSI